MSVLNEPVLVLNRNWQPVTFLPVQVAIVNVMRDMASVLDAQNYLLLTFEEWAVSEPDTDRWIKTARDPIPAPEVIVLKKYGERPPRKIVFNRPNLAKRDAHQCFASGTPVQLGGGRWVSIEDVSIGDSIITATGVSVVTDKMAQEPSRPCVSVKPYYGLPVVVTDDHKFLVLDRAGGLRFVPAAELKGHHVVWPLDRTGDVITLPAPLARLIGYFMSEGHTARDYRDGVEQYVGFTIAPHEDELAEGIKSAVRAVLSLDDKHIADKINVDPRNGNQSRRINVGSRELARIVKTYVSGRKARVKQFPFDPINLDERTATELFEAMMSGDGCDLMTRDSPTRVLTTASRTLALQSQRLAWGLGRFASIVQGRQVNFNPGAPVYHVRWFPETTRHLGKVVRVDGHTYMSAPVQYVRDVSYDGLVWDLTVRSEDERGHTFVTSAGIASNCQYCGADLFREKITVEHILPRSRGGPTSWENCVAACESCNSRKADQTPQEAGMRLRTVPKVPAWRTRLRAPRGVVRPSWEPFLAKELESA